MEGKKINKPGAKERADALWETMMQRLIEYKEKVGVNKIYSEITLGLFVSHSMRISPLEW